MGLVSILTTLLAKLLGISAQLRGRVAGTNPRVPGLNLQTVGDGLGPVLAGYLCWLHRTPTPDSCHFHLLEYPGRDTRSCIVSQIEILNGGHLVVL